MKHFITIKLLEKADFLGIVDKILSSCLMDFVHWTTPTPPHPPVLNGQNQDGRNTIQNQLKNTHPLYTVRCSHQIYLLFLVVLCCTLWDAASRYIFYFVLFCIRFYISRYHFSLIFRASYNIWKKDLCCEFSFFNRFGQSHPTTYPLNCRSPPTLWHEMIEFNEFSV